MGHEVATINPHQSVFDTWIVVANEPEDLYANPDWMYLSVQNPHFNILHAYDFFVKHNQDERIIGNHLQLQIETAISENFLGSGRYDLELIKQPSGIEIFTNPSFPDQGLIETANRAVQERQLKQLPYQREVREKDLAEKLTHFFEENQIGSSCLWTSPPGEDEGYSDQMSISYIGKIISSETSANGKKLHIELLVHTLSIPGHQALLEKITHQQYQSFITDHDFVGELTYLSDDAQIQSVEDLKQTISELELQGLVNPRAKPKKYLNQKIITAASSQIQEFCIFLHEVFNKTYFTIGLQLKQSDVNNLEKAYSLGYRSVLSYFNKKQPITTEQMLMDLYQAEQIVARISKNEESITPEEFWMTHVYLSQLTDRYGDLSQMSVGGSGCPGGILAGLGIDSVPVSGIQYDLISSPISGESTMHCVTCPFCKKQVDAILTPTHIICPECHSKANRNQT